ncbi:MAG: DNA ligase [Clostridia bacterium]|nr:DNA ligase [Clostridia bacterium]
MREVFTIDQTNIHLPLLKPMIPRSYPKPFDSESHIFQIKWDGIRYLAYVEDGRIRLLNRQLRERSYLYPEMRELSQAISSPAILDGEMIALHQGKPSFPHIIKRESRNRPSVEIPIIYMVFDILWLKNANLVNLPLEKRQAILETELRPSGHVRVTDSFPVHGKALYAAAEKQGLEGIVAKHKLSPYLPGVRSDKWLKIKCWREIDLYIGGFTVKDGRITSLLAGIPEGGRLRYVGNIAISQRISHSANQLKMLATSHCPFDRPPKFPGFQVVYILPSSKAKVKFLEWTPGGKLRAARLVDIIPT